MQDAEARHDHERKGSIGHYVKGTGLCSQLLLFLILPGARFRKRWIALLWTVCVMTSSVLLRQRKKRDLIFYNSTWLMVICWQAFSHHLRTGVAMSMEETWSHVCAIHWRSLMPCVLPGLSTSRSRLHFLLQIVCRQASPLKTQWL